ncbi:MAG TPA: serine/threonine-protein kinase [Polyangia bacterium]|jgi:serine/threonine protein kinase
MRSVAPRESAARRYRIEKYLTEGGMGAIYLGKKMGSGGFQKEVVLKQLLPEYTSRPEFRDLFFREAKISATLDHANIVHTFDLVESDQSLFIVMEYVRGADLRTILRRARQRQRELSPAAAIHIALEILTGLTYAHARRGRDGHSLNIIHRDVSPSNIICSVQGEAKLSDFGIAKASTHSSVFYRVRGKVGYMSPEQARSQPIDHRCDLYSLAVCLYESLSGERLFVGDLNTPADEIYGHTILPISQKRPGLPRALDVVLARALAPDIADRHQSGAELSDALRTVAHKTGLAFSAPELAAHLREILGSDTDRWLRDDAGTPMVDGKQPVPPASIGLVGKEAASIGLVADVPEDEQPPIVLSPSPVSGSKDFDIDSMLSDEATRPGGRGPAPLQSPNEVVTPESNSLRRGTPPPVWTRSSGPIPIVTPPPARAAVASARTLPLPTRMAPPPPPAPPPVRAAPPPRAVSPPTAPLPAPPPVPLPGRMLPRATQRGLPVPPPFPAAARVPAPPPLPEARASQAREIEEQTPPPAGHHADGFDIDESPPALGGPLPAPTLLGFGSAPNLGRAPPMGYQAAQAAMAAYADPAAPVAVGPRLSQPQTISFQGTSLLPEKKSGPPRWLAIIGLVGSVAGGAVLAERATRSDVATLTASLDVPRPAKAPASPPPVDDLDDSPPTAGKAPVHQPAVEALPPAEVTPPPVPPVAARPAATRGHAHASRPAAKHRPFAVSHKKPAGRR